MRYSLGLLTTVSVNVSASVFLFAFPVEAVVKDGLSVASEEVKIAQLQGNKQRKNQALRLNQSGLQEFNKGEFRKALNYFEQALVILEKIGESEIEASVINNIGAVYRKLGEYPKALDYYHQALAIHKQFSNKAGVGTTMSNIGTIYLYWGEHQKALNYHQKSLAIFKQIDNKASEAYSLNNIGLVYKTLGEYTKALDYHQQSLAIKKQIGDKAGEATSLNNIGEVYLYWGEYTKALNYFQQSLAIHKQVGNKPMEGNTLKNIGEVYFSLGEYGKALDYFQQSLAIHKASVNKLLEGATLNNIGQVYFSLGKYTTALDYYQKSLAINKQVAYKLMEATNLNNIGQVYLNLEEYTKALDYYQQSLAIFKQISNKAGNAISLNNIGLIYKHLGEYPKALNYYQQALAIMKKNGDKAGEATTLNNIGVIYKSINKYPEAEKTLFAAIEILESLRPGLTDEQKISFFDIRSASYRFLQESLIAQNKTNKALEISERSKARALVELLSSKFNSNQQLNIKPPNIEQIKQIAQQQKATFVEYSVIDESQLYIWVIKPTGEIRFKQVDIKSLDTPLDKLVKNSRVSIGARGRAGIDVVPVKNPVNQKQNLQKLHELLIKPIASHLPTNPDERVIFIPDESLFLVPFPALMDASGKYLIEKHTIMTAPAIQVLELTNKNNAAKLNFNSLQPKDLLVVGNPTMPKIGIPPVQLSSLKGAETEAKAIAKLFNTTALTGNQATKSTVLEKISSARVIHFATHGLLDGKDFGELTPGAIALAPDTSPSSLLNKGGQRGVDVNEGLLKTTEIIDMKLNADLVVLSACDTGRGQITGDGVIGLSRSLITAGASSVIVSLWKIPDYSTSELMTEFYRQWEKTGDKAKALRTAMLITMKTNPEPIDWVPRTIDNIAQPLCRCGFRVVNKLVFSWWPHRHKPKFWVFYRHFV